MCFSHFIEVLAKAESHVFKAWDIRFKTKLKIKAEGEVPRLLQGMEQTASALLWLLEGVCVMLHSLAPSEVWGLRPRSLFSRSGTAAQGQPRRDSHATASRSAPFSGLCLRSRLMLQLVAVTGTFLHRPKNHIRIHKLVQQDDGTASASFS